MKKKLLPFIWLFVAYVVFTKFVAPVAIKRASRPRRKDTSIQRMVNMYSKVREFRYDDRPLKKNNKKKNKQKSESAFARISRKAKDKYKQYKNKTKK
jgi:hypothetical protein